jgi:hypothetical protein
LPNHVPESSARRSVKVICVTERVRLPWRAVLIRKGGRRGDSRPDPRQGAAVVIVPRKWRAMTTHDQAATSVLYPGNEPATER